MSQASQTIRTPNALQQSNTEIENDAAVQSYFEALEDADCRAILNATTDVSLSASEISEHLDIPLSSTYRKLELLTDAGLLAESVRLRQSGKHTNEFTRDVGDVTVAIEADRGVVLHVSDHETGFSATAD